MQNALSCPSTLHIPRTLLSIAGLTLALQACSSGDSGDSNNGLHADLQECTDLLDVLTAEQINDVGSCVYELADGTSGVATIGGGADTLVSPVDDTPIDRGELAGDVSRDLALADVAGSDFYPDANNTAILSGAVIGDGSVDNSILSRSVPFQVGVIASGISVEHVYAVRSSGVQTNMLTVVRNASDQPQCFVYSSEVSVVDQQSDSVLPLFYGAFAEGPLFLLNSGLVTNTCLDPGQLAYLPTQFDVPLEHVKAYSIGEIRSREISGADKMLSKVVPISYEVLANGGVEVLVANQGLAPVELSTGYTLLLDNDGFPLAIGYGYSEEKLNPGDETAIGVGFNGFDGTATLVRMIVDADPVE